MVAAPPSDFQLQLVNLALAIEVVFALALFVLAYISYRRTGNPRLGFVAVAFLLFFVKGLILSAGLYGILPATPDIWAVLLDLFTLVVLYVGVMRR